MSTKKVSGVIMLKKLARINFFNGRMLTADDLRQEQEYYRTQHRLHNQWLHGSGIVSGLHVSIDPHHSSAVHIEPGLALDCCGNEIRISETTELELPTTRQPVYLCVKYCEQEIELIPIPIESTGSDNSMVASRIEEGFEVAFAPSNPFVNHKRNGNAWRACGEAHGIPLARFRSTGKIILDRRFVFSRMSDIA